MSTGLECLIVEREKSQWFYILEQNGSPKGCWDWLDYADAFGPFVSEEVALKHLFNHHANPGGHSVIRKEHFDAWPTSGKEKISGLMDHPMECSKGVDKYGIFWI